MTGPEPPPEVARLIAEATALYQVKGLSYAEVAARVGEPEPEVRRAIAKFAAFIGLTLRPEDTPPPRRRGAP